jgi:hypothetical protein
MSETFKLIPCFNKKKEITDYALVSNEDYEKVNKYNWSISKKKDSNYKCVNAIVNSKLITLSRFIYGNPININNIIDHINNNSLDNIRENLRECSKSANSQNKKKIINDTFTSKYIGVRKRQNKWISDINHNNIYYYLGRFEKEEEAAIQYDKAAFIIYGENASTNNLVKYEEITGLTLENIKPKKNIKTNNDGIELPKNISFKHNGYEINVIYNKKKFYSRHLTLKEAIDKLQTYNEEINIIKNKKEQEHMLKEITKNSNNEAIIIINNSKKDKKYEVIVDENKWHNLTKFKWVICSKKNYVQARIDGKMILMHRFLMNATSTDIIDHINQNGFDNKLCNLRFINYSNNAHNRKKQRNNTFSIYKGVTNSRLKKNPYNTSITQNYKNISLGSYNNELQAAYAYNLKAIELFGEYANINKIDIDENTKEDWKEEIYTKWKK